MIHGYHLIMPMYGSWLPNDPRGSWSEVVRRWELAQYGKPRKRHDRPTVSQLNAAEQAQRVAARKALKFPAVRLNGRQAQAVGQGFATKTKSSRYTIWACAILPTHTHLVLARHRYKIEQIANLLKGEATRAVSAASLHPLAAHRNSRGKVPPMWAARPWKIYLDSELAIENAIRYVEQNPVEENKPLQNWSFVTKFHGIDPGGWTTY